MKTTIATTACVVGGRRSPGRFVANQLETPEFIIRHCSLAADAAVAGFTGPTMLRYLMLILLLTTVLGRCFAYGDADARINNHDIVRDDAAKDATESATNGTSAEAPKEATNSTTQAAPENSSANATKPDPPLSSLYINTVKPALGSPLTETVFKEKSLVAAFNSCRIASDDAGRIANTSACFRDDEFNDRLTFEMSYGLHGSAVEQSFKERPPKLQILGDSSKSATSQLTETSVQAEASTAKVTVSYLCKRNANALISLKLTMHFAVGDNASVTILWTKQCTSGVNSQIDFGYAVEGNGNDETVYHKFGSDADAPYVVVPSDKSTEVYAKLLVPGAQQAFLAPLVHSADPAVVEIAVRGNHPNGGTLKGLEASLFQVSYECLRGKGSSKIAVSVGIPPFQNLSASWTKECGGAVPKQLSVGSAEGKFDIVDLGKPTPKYMVAIGNIGTPHSEEHLHLPGNQSEWTIYLQYGDSSSEGVGSKDAALHLGRVGITVENRDTIVALAPQVSRKGSYGWRDVPNSENVIRAGDSLRISFRFVCRKVGESRLLFTLPLVHYDMLEFGIAKECDHVEAISQRSREWVLTVGNVFCGFVMVVIGVAIAYYLKIRSKATAGFEPVSTTEK